MTCRPSFFFWWTSLKLPMPWSLLVQPHVWKFSQGLELLLLGIVQLLAQKSGFSRQVADAVSTDLQKSKSFFHQGRRSKFLHCYCRRNIAPRKATFRQLPEFFLYIWKYLKFSVLAIKGYRLFLNDVFILYVMGIAANAVISCMFSSFEGSFPPRKIKPPDWNVSGSEEP